jgi:hypothetical protein
MDEIEDYDNNEWTRDILRTISTDDPVGNTSTGFYYNPTQSYYDYKTSYLNALLLLGIFETTKDLKPVLADYHPIQAIIRNATKHGLYLKVITDIKSSACASGVLLCKNNKIWYAMDITNKKRVDSKTGKIVWGMLSQVALIYKIEYVANLSTREGEEGRK